MRYAVTFTPSPLCCILLFLIPATYFLVWRPFRKWSKRRKFNRAKASEYKFKSMMPSIHAKLEQIGHFYDPTCSWELLPRPFAGEKSHLLGYVLKIAGNDTPQKVAGVTYWYGYVYVQLLLTPKGEFVLVQAANTPDQKLPMDVNVILKAIDVICSHNEHIKLL